MKLTPYGKKEALAVAAITIVACAAVAAVAVLTEIPWISLAGFPVIVLGVFGMLFFRDPERTPPPGENKIVSPADGVVTHIQDVESAPFLDGPSRKVSIFMNLFNVHVNRAPLKGTVEFVEHTPGKFLNAGHEEAMEVNENTVLGIKNERGKFLVKQISGVIARRIVCASKPGDELARGGRFGMIKFGSRLEVFIPREIKWTEKVKPGDKVKAGETVIGELSNEEHE